MQKKVEITINYKIKKLEDQLYIVFNKNRTIL